MSYTLYVPPPPPDIFNQQNQHNFSLFQTHMPEIFYSQIAQEKNYEMSLKLTEPALSP